MSNEVRLHDGSQVRGVVYALLGGVCLSTGGVALRFVEAASGWQILTYRALAFMLFMLVVLGARYRLNIVGAVRDIGWLGIIVAVLLGTGAVAYVFAMLNTTVANVVVILSVSPLLTALLGWMFLKERVDAFAVAMMLAAVVGIAIMFSDGIAAGGLIGMLIAVIAVLVFAVLLVLLRFSRGRDMLPATALSGVVTLLIAALMADDFSISLRDAGIGAFLGIFQFGAGFVLLTLATRHIQAALVALLSLAEVVLAPVWVWLGVGEVPSMLAMTGGTLVLAAVVVQGLRELG